MLDLDPRVLMLLAVAAAVGGTILYQRSRRRKDLALLAREMGLTYKDADPNLPAQFAEFQLLPSGSDPRCVNVVRGKIGRVTVQLCDYISYRRGGETRHGRRQECTVCALHSSELVLPGFYLRQEHPLLDRLGDMLIKKGVGPAGNRIATVFGGGDIDFADDEPFSRKFVLQGNEQEIRPVFDQEVRRQLLLLDVMVVGVEGRGKTLLLAAQGQIPAKKVRELIQQGQELVRVFARAAASAPAS